MKTVTIEIRSADEAVENMLTAAEAGCPQESATITFISRDLFQQVLTDERRQILKQLCGARPMMVSELAGRLAREVKAVHTDIEALLDAGVVDRKPGGSISFPYDEVIYPTPDSGGKCRFH